MKNFTEINPEAFDIICENSITGERYVYLSFGIKDFKLFKDILSDNNSIGAKVYSIRRKAIY